MQNKTLVRR